MSNRKVVRWAVRWRHKNKRDGAYAHWMWDGTRPYLFRTRREAREWIEASHGYIRQRPDLRAEPFGWKLPVPVRVAVELKPCT